MRDEKGRFIKGHIPWLKGKVGITSNTGRTWFKKDDSRITGKNHWNWKENPTYSVLHDWIERKKGMPTKCQQCGRESNSRRIIQWANVDGKYKRDLDDYIALCSKCHFGYDLQNTRIRDYHGRFI